MGSPLLLKMGSLSGKTLHLDNIQIVNGLQTSQTIYKVLKEKGDSKDKRSLMLKIIITEDPKTMDAIIKATNSQNQVPTSSLRATDQIQREIEEYLLSKNSMIEGRISTKMRVSQEKNNIYLFILSQCLTALLDKNPSKARSNPTTLIKGDADYNKLFHKGRNLETYHKVIVLADQSK